MPRLNRERALDRFHGFLRQAERVAARGQVGPQRGMSLIGLSRPQEQLARFRRLVTQHHSQAELVQDCRMGGCRLCCVRQELVRLRFAAGRSRRLGGLNQPQDRGAVRGRGIDVAQEIHLWCLSLARRF